MKKLVCYTILNLLIGSLSAQTMKVKLKGVNYKVGGDMNIAIYNSEEGFLHVEHAVYLKKDKVVGEVQFFLIKEIPFGNYAIAVYHDENLDGRLNTNFMKIPSEGFGFSNNPGFGKPSYSKSVFEFDTDNQQVIIEMNY